MLSLVVYFGIVAFLLVTLTERRRRFRLLTCFTCGAAVGLVAVSRIYLDMHWLSDVIGGLSLGAAYLLIAIWVSQRLGAARPVAAAVGGGAARVGGWPGGGSSCGSRSCGAAAGAPRVGAEPQDRWGPDPGAGRRPLIGDAAHNR